MKLDGKKSRLVLVVDDDPAVRDSTVRLLVIAGHRVVAFESGQALLDAGVPEATDLIMLDIMMPGLNGLETLRALQRQEGELPPVVILTGHGDVPLAVEAMKLGAAEFFEKPYPVAKLLDFVASLKPTSGERDVADLQRQEARGRIAVLSGRQREILKGIASGEPSKVTAHRLGLSVRTVETYRGHVFARLAVRGMVDAARIAILAGLLEE